MAECKQCGKEMGFADRINAKSYDGLCMSCVNANTNKLSETIVSISEEEKASIERIEAVLLTTETAPNLDITKRIEIVSAECAFGMNIFKDLLVGVRDIVGGRSETVQKTMRDARRTVLHELKHEAHLVGANAVVGVDLDYVELSKAGSMIMLVASGTAVIIGNDD